MERVEKSAACELCGSTTDYLNFHHLIPRTLHSNKYFEKRYEKEWMRFHGIWICKAFCHKQIHEFIEEKEMGMNYNTLDLLKEHPEVKKYVEWRRKRVS
jgi:5-methylcytosine-specific restriction endonuclease McrA